MRQIKSVCKTLLNIIIESVDLLTKIDSKLIVVLSNIL